MRRGCPPRSTEMCLGKDGAALELQLTDLPGDMLLVILDSLHDLRDRLMACLASSRLWQLGFRRALEAVLEAHINLPPGRFMHVKRDGGCVRVFFQMDSDDAPLDRLLLLDRFMRRAARPAALQPSGRSMAYKSFLRPYGKAWHGSSLTGTGPGFWLDMPPVFQPSQQELPDAAQAEQGGFCIGHLPSSGGAGCRPCMLASGTAGGYAFKLTHLRVQLLLEGGQAEARLLLYSVKPVLTPSNLQRNRVEFQ